MARTWRVPLVSPMIGAGQVVRGWDRWPGSRRRSEHGRLVLTELDVRRLDERIDALLDVLAQVCDYSGQPEVAREFRALSGQAVQPGQAAQPAPAEPVLRLVRGSQ